MIAGREECARRYGVLESICKQRLFKQGAFLILETRSLGSALQGNESQSKGLCQDEQVVLLVLSPCDLFRGCNPLVRAHLLPWLDRCLSLSACMLIASVLHASLVLSLSSVLSWSPLCHEPTAIIHVDC